MLDLAIERIKFIELLSEICRHPMVVGKPPVDRGEKFLRTRLRVDGIDFDLFHFPPPGANLLIQCIFGRPGANRIRCLQTMMLANAATAISFAGMFALNVESGQLVYSTPDDLDRASPPHLVENMKEAAGIAMTWRAQGIVQE